MNRIQLVVDSIFLSQSGHMDYNVTFLILNYLQLELEFVPVGAALYTIGSLHNLLRRTSYIDIFRVSIFTIYFKLMYVNIIQDVILIFKLIF